MRIRLWENAVPILERRLRYPERSRGIPLGKLKDNFHGIPRLSLGMTISAAATTLPPLARPHDSPASTFRRVLPQFDAKERDQFQTRRVWL